MKFLCDNCKAKYQIADEKVAGKTVRMKCRKCGHAIEVRAAVTETSVASALERESTPPDRPSAPARPAPPRAKGLTTSLGAARPVPPRQKDSALHGAFQEGVKKESITDDLSPRDDWYVAINGVPVGPIRIAEIRRKAAMGSVTEESLVWQEGHEEWRPVKSFSELASVVREAMAEGRASLVPERRSSIPPRVAPIPERRSAPPPAARVGASPRPGAVAPLAAAPLPTHRSNVVPIGSRLATAERLSDPEPLRPPPTATSAFPQAQPDPFAAPMPGYSAPAVAAAPDVAPRASTRPSLPPTRKQGRGMSWILIALVALAVSFGAVAALAIFFGPGTKIAPTVILSAAPPLPGVPEARENPVANADTPSTLSSGGATRTTQAGAVAVAAAGSNRGAAAANSATASTGGGLDLGSLKRERGDSPNPENDPGISRPAGECYTQQQVGSMIGQRQVAIRRMCWERAGGKSGVNISVNMTIGPTGGVDSVSASGNDPQVARCVENDVRNWRFAAGGCSQRVAFSFKFVSQ